MTIRVYLDFDPKNGLKMEKGLFYECLLEQHHRN